MVYSSPFIFHPPQKPSFCLLKWESFVVLATEGKVLNGHCIYFELSFSKDFYVHKHQDKRLSTFCKMAKVLRSILPAAIFCLLLILFRVESTDRFLRWRNLARTGSP